jgi:hypothetical protein
VKGPKRAKDLGSNRETAERLLNSSQSSASLSKAFEFEETAGTPEETQRAEVAEFDAK